MNMNFTPEETQFLLERGFTLYPQSSIKYEASKYSNGIYEEITRTERFISEVQIKYGRIFKGNFQFSRYNSIEFSKTTDNLDQAIIALEELRQEIHSELKRLTEIL